MNPHLLKVLPNHDHSFSIRRDIVPYFFNKWHYHPEVELIHIVKGSGTQFMGDDIRRFQPGDVVLVGTNLPHFWRCDDRYFEADNPSHAEAVVAHFRQDFWGPHFLSLTENVNIRTLLEKAQRGIAISGRIKQQVITLMEEMTGATGTRRIILLLDILSTIGSEKSHTVLSSTGFRPTGEVQDDERINKIYAYSLAHFKNKIYLDDVARHANISTNSFCRYFKLHSRKTYNSFLQELRVGHASKMLIENRKSITQVCYESGFNNVTNFYKTFKRITGKTPMDYQKVFVRSQADYVF